MFQFYFYSDFGKIRVEGFVDRKKKSHALVTLLNKYYPTTKS